jgi:DNA polymerase III delta subunit
VATPTDVRKQIASGETRPLYLVEGGDVQSRNDLAQEFLAIVDEGLHVFNVETLHAADASSVAARDQLIGTLLSSARTLPMMSPRRVIIMHDAERLLSPKRKDDEEGPEAAAPSGKRKRVLTPLEELEAYFEAPEPLTTVVFAAGQLDANRRLVKQLRGRAIVVDSGSLDSETDAAKWIKGRLDRDELAIDDVAIRELLKATGLELGTIRAEIEKLALYAAGENKITVTHVRDVVIPQDEAPGEKFPMSRALQNSDVKLALKEIDARLDAGVPPVMVLGLIRAATHSLRGPAIKNGLDAVFQTDLAIKSSAGEPRYLLERLVIELCARS